MIPYKEREIYYTEDGRLMDVLDLLNGNFDIRIESIRIPKIDNPERQTGTPNNAYWWEKDDIYNSPILILK